MAPSFSRTGRPPERRAAVKGKAKAKARAAAKARERTVVAKEKEKTAAEKEKGAAGEDTNRPTSASNSRSTAAVITVCTKERGVEPNANCARHGVEPSVAKLHNVGNRLITGKPSNVEGGSGGHC